MSICCCCFSQVWGGILFVQINLISLLKITEFNYAACTENHKRLEETKTKTNNREFNFHQKNIWAKFELFYKIFFLKIELITSTHKPINFNKSFLWKLIILNVCHTSSFFNIIHVSFSPSRKITKNILLRIPKCVFQRMEELLHIL